EERLELVAGRGDQDSLDLIEKPEPRHILKKHGRPQALAIRVANRQDPGQQASVAAAAAEHDGAVETFGEIVVLALERLGERLPEGFGRLPGRRRRLAV